MWLFTAALMLPTVAASTPPACTAELGRLCGATSAAPCAICAGDSQHALRLSGCTSADVQTFCDSRGAALTLQLAPDSAPHFPPGRRYTPAQFWAASPILPLAVGLGFIIRLSLN
jgi:hypothetical protein